MTELNVVAAWDRIWAPHRKDYLVNEAGQHGSDNCPFCVAPELSDADGLVVVRGETCYVVMNKYPYASGHLLVCTYRHVATYDQISEAELLEFGLLTQQAMRTLSVVSGCAGFNLGMNQGKVGGAGVQEHLHQHVVPRWSGDANFMPIIGKTKVLPQLLTMTRDELAAAW